MSFAWWRQPAAGDLFNRSIAARQLHAGQQLNDRPARVELTRARAELGAAGEAVVIVVELGSAAPALVALGIGALFTAKLVLNPNFVYMIRIGSAAGFVPFVEVPGATDSRLLGARVRIEPVYEPDPAAARATSP